MEQKIIDAKKAKSNWEFMLFFTFLGYLWLIVVSILIVAHVMQTNSELASLAGLIMGVTYSIGGAFADRWNKHIMKKINEAKAILQSDQYDI